MINRRSLLKLAPALLTPLLVGRAPVIRVLPDPPLDEGPIWVRAVFKPGGFIRYFFSREGAVPVVKEWVECQGGALELYVPPEYKSPIEFSARLLPPAAGEFWRFGSGAGYNLMWNNPHDND